MIKFLRSLIPFLLALALPAFSAPNPENKIVGYYVSWDARRKPPFLPKAINGNLITHLNYAFAKVDAAGTITLLAPKEDIGSTETNWKSLKDYKGNFLAIKQLKKQYPHLKTLISFGGWTLSEPFSALAASPTARAHFIEEIIAFCKKFDFDGLDIDWEYPCLALHGGRPQDKQNFTLFLSDIYTAAKKQKPPLLLTIAGPATVTRYQELEIENIHKYVDWINLMSYNFHGPSKGKGDEVTNHHAPLFSTKIGNPLLNTNTTVQYYLSKGVPSKKIVIGLPLYGRTYSLVTTSSDGLHSQYKGAGKGTTVEGVRSLADIRRNFVGKYTRHWDAQAQAPYLYSAKNKEFITYDDDQSLATKCLYIKKNQLGGAMVWQLGWDARPDWPALRVIHSVLQN